MKHFLLSTALSLPLATAAFAAGGGDEQAPTKPKCKAGQVYDKNTKSCVVAREGMLDTDGYYENVRSLSHDGRYEEAQAVLALMPQDDDRTLTYLGFTHRKQGDLAQGMAYYGKALALNPSNVLARSYMGQGLVEEGRIAEALQQLQAIRDHGGSGTWAETSLRTAIATGKTFTY